MMLYAYMRVSTPQQTLENQHYALLKFADQRGLRIDAWITESSSGAKAYTERALGQLLAQLRPQDTVLVAEISRLGRRLLDILQIVHRLMDAQVTLISVKEGLEVGNTLNGKVLAFAFGLAVDLERYLLVARTREALARRRQEGQHLGRPPGRLSTQTKLTGRDQEIRMLLQKKVAVAAIARIMGVHRTTMAHYVASRSLRER
jgi:DNA invertase Pin-like site-specific DNA recombinase